MNLAFVYLESSLVLAHAGKSFAKFRIRTMAMFVHDISVGILVMSHILLAVTMAVAATIASPASDDKDDICM